MAYTTAAKVKSIAGITNTDWDTEIGYHITYVDNYLDSRVGALGLSGSTILEGIATDLVLARFLESSSIPSFTVERVAAIRKRAEQALNEYCKHRIREGDVTTDGYRGGVWIG